MAANMDTMPVMTPEQLTKEKAAQCNMLDEQLGAALKQIDMRMKNDVTMLKYKADASKKNYCMNVDFETGKTEGQMVQAAEQEKMNVTQQATAQKASIETNALTKIMDYEKNTADEQMKKAQSDMVMQQEQMNQKMQAEVDRLSSSQTGPQTGEGVMAPQGVPMPQIRAPDMNNLSHAAQKAGGLNLSRMPPPMQARPAPSKQSGAASSPQQSK